jgi:hypothetical protein
LALLFVGDGLAGLAIAFAYAGQRTHCELHLRAYAEQSATIGARHLETIRTLFSITEGTVGGGLILLFVGAVLAGLGRLVLQTSEDRRERRKRLKLEEHEQARAQNERNQHLREVIVDVILHAEFDKESVRRITDHQQIDAMKVVIASTENYRPFIAFEARDPTFDDYRTIRRQLDTPLMVACDRFFDLSQLFQAYYEKLASDEFVALSKARKFSALDRLVEIGARVNRAYDEVAAKMQASSISQDIYNDVIGVLPNKNAAGNDPNGT